MRSACKSWQLSFSSCHLTEWPTLQVPLVCYLYKAKHPIKDDLYIWFQVGSCCVKLILVGLLCPLIGQELTEGFSVVLIPWYTKQYIFHPFSWVNVQGLATFHQGVDDGSTHRSILVPAEQEVLPKANGLIAFSTRLLSMQKSLIHIAAQAWQKREHITYGFPDATVLWSLGHNYLLPLLELRITG